MLSAEEKVEMLIDFIHLAMNEDCTGIALSNSMEKVESWLSSDAWITEHEHDPNRDKEQMVKDAENMEFIEQWWADGMKDE